jgi:conjugal transfer ATP-binding protein TraC
MLRQESFLEDQTIKAWKEFTKISRLHRFLPYESYDPENKLFYNKGATGFVLSGCPIVGASLNDQSTLAHFFTLEENLPEGCSIQFMLFASPRIQNRLSYWKSYRMPGIFQHLSEKRTDFLQEKAFHDVDGHLVRDFKLLISYTLPGHKRDVMERSQLLETRATFQNCLKQIGVSTEVMDDEGLINDVRDILNASHTTTSSDHRINPHEPLNRQILEPDRLVRMFEHGVSLGEGILAKSFIPSKAPPYWALSHMDKFLGDALKPNHAIPCLYILHYGLFVTPHQGREKSRLNTKREALENALKNRMSKWMQGLSEEHLETQEAVAQLQLGERVVLAGLSLTVLAPENQIQIVEQQLNSIWQNAGWRFQQARYDHLSLLLSSMPMMWTLGVTQKHLGLTQEVHGCATILEDLGRIRKTITKEAQNMLPLLGEWKGQVSPGIPLLGRRGQLFFWSPFDGVLLPNQQLPSSSSNYNLCISGMSGSGKSFLCNELITTTLSVGGKAFVLDKGESFKKLCHILGGHHLDFDVTTNISLNPFTHIPEGEAGDDLIERSEQLGALLQVVKTMAIPRGEISEIQESFLLEAIDHAWEQKKSQAELDDLYQYLLHHKDSRAQDLAKTLRLYSKGGAYGSFFNGPATLNLSHDLVVIETQNLKDNLKAVIVQMMMVHAWQRMTRSDRSYPYLILIDEAWELIQGKSSGTFIEKVVRTARKYRASLTLATQNLTDYFKPESPGATVAFQNSEWKAVLHQSADVTTSLHHHPQLQELVNNSYRESLLRFLGKAERFSEIALYSNSVGGVIGRLACDPWSTLLYSSNPQDYLKVQESLKQGLSVAEAIDKVLDSQEKLG